MKQILYLLLLLASLTIQAATLKGSVTDRRTGELLIGATVRLMNGTQSTRCGGKFITDSQRAKVSGIYCTSKTICLNQR